MDLPFPFGGAEHPGEGREQMWENWEVSTIRVLDVRFPNNSFKKKKLIQFLRKAQNNPSS